MAKTKITLGASHAAELIYPPSDYLNGSEIVTEYGKGEEIENWVADRFHFELNGRIFNNNISLFRYKDYRNKDCLILNAKPDGVRGNQIIEVKSGLGEERLVYQKLVGEVQVILSALAAKDEIKDPEPLLILVNTKNWETEEVYLKYDQSQAMGYAFDALNEYAKMRKRKNMSAPESEKHGCPNNQHNLALDAARGIVPHIYSGR